MLSNKGIQEFDIPSNELEHLVTIDLLVHHIPAE
jgi:hypothetical protein